MLLNIVCIWFCRQLLGAHKLARLTAGNRTSPSDDQVLVDLETRLVELLIEIRRRVRLKLTTHPSAVRSAERGTTSGSDQSMTDHSVYSYVIQDTWEEFFHRFSDTILVSQAGR